MVQRLKDHLTGFTCLPWRDFVLLNTYSDISFNKYNITPVVTMSGLGQGFSGFFIFSISG
jgi:hypothetical protein